MSAALVIQPPLGIGRLRLVRFASLDDWSPSSSTGNLDFHSEIPLRPLADALQVVRHSIIVQAGTQYHRVTVRINGNGVCRRDTVNGSVIKTKRQFRVSAGQLIMSRIDARNGAFGLIPDDLDGAIVTNDFPVFAVRQDRMLPNYLRLVLSTPRFREYCQTLSKGTTNRQRMDEGTFLSIPIPFPAIEEQAKLIAEERTAFLEAETAESRAREADLQVVRFLEESLGLKPRAEKTRLASNTLHFARFATLERWGEILHGPADVQSGAKFPMVSLRDVIADLQNGWSPKCHDRPASPEEWGVLKLGAVSFGEYNEAANKALPESLQPTPQYEIKANDVLISRANITQYVGACVHVLSTRSRLILCDKIFRVVFKSNSPVDERFLAAVLKIHPVRQQVEKSLTGTSPTMKNISKPALLNLQFPLPPLPEQKRIVTGLERLRAEARAARATAAACREAAAKSFHAALFAQ